MMRQLQEVAARCRPVAATELAGVALGGQARAGSIADPDGG